MNNSISADTQAILLVTAPLILGRAGESADRLTPGEYGRLASCLREGQRRPGDLLTEDPQEILAGQDPGIDPARLTRLLARGFLLSQAIEHWSARALWVVSRADESYPRRLRERLKDGSPPILYGCGDRTLLESGGLAVVGSRNVDEALIEYTQGVGRLVAQAGHVLISGGARGIDRASMQGAIDEGGRVVGVLADSLERNALNHENRRLLMDGQLTLISPYDPAAGFNVGNAMQRNKLIYALAEAALVVSSDFNKGGTWAGAVEQLSKLRYVPIYARNATGPEPGLDALRRKGALAWPDPASAKAMRAVIEQGGPDVEQTPVQCQFTLETGQAPDQHDRVADSEAPLLPSSEDARGSQTEIVQFAGAESADGERERILTALQTTCTEAELVESLGMKRGPLREWLKRLVGEGSVVKRVPPPTYEVRRAGLFEIQPTPAPKRRASKE